MSKGKRKLAEEKIVEVEEGKMLGQSEAKDEFNKLIKLKIEK